jgi:hypothetical protein
MLCRHLRRLAYLFAPLPTSGDVGYKYGHRLRWLAGMKKAAFAAFVVYGLGSTGGVPG